jgi:hypothetical protein
LFQLGIGCKIQKLQFFATIESTSRNSGDARWNQYFDQSTIKKALFANYLNAI